MITAATNIIVESFALIVTLLLLLCSWLDRSAKTRMRFLMRAILILNIGLLAACIATWVLEGNAEYEGLNTVITAFANGLGFPMAGIYTEYVACSIGMHAAKPKKFALIIEGLCILAFALNLISIFNGMYYTCIGGIYRRGPLFILNQLSATLILAPNAVMVMKYSRKLGTGETVALLAFPVFPLLASLSQFAVSGLTTMCLATTLTVIMMYIAAYLKRGWTIMNQEKELTESRVAVMLSQIQPHFLYNALSSIAELCRENPAKARTSVLDFAEYLRGNLKSLQTKRTVSIDDELSHVRRYLSLEKMRFEDSLCVVYDICATGFYLPQLSVQPLVENAVKHGVGESEGGGTVTIRTWEDTNSWCVAVEDDGVGFDPDEAAHDGQIHIGLENVSNRIAGLSGGTLTVTSQKGHGTSAVIRIPKEEAGI